MPKRRGSLLRRREAQKLHRFLHMGICLRACSLTCARSTFSPTSLRPTTRRLLKEKGMLLQSSAGAWIGSAALRVTPSPQWGVETRQCHVSRKLCQLCFRVSLPPAFMQLQQGFAVVGRDNSKVFEHDQFVRDYEVAPAPRPAG